MRLAKAVSVVLVGLYFLGMGVSLKAAEITKPKDDWFAFDFPWEKESPPSAINVSYLLDPPAGKHGFVKVKDGHFYFDDGTRARFWGTNIGWGSPYLSPDQAEKVANYLASRGINLVRFMLGYKGQHDPSAPIIKERLKKLDYLIYQLKKRGIYTYFYITFWDNKGASHYVPELITYQKNFWTQLLTHTNPYTKLKLVDDPSLAFLVTTNENEIFYRVRIPGVVSSSNLAILKNKWNKWLLRKYGNRAGLKRAWEKMGATPPLASREDPAKNNISIPGMENKYKGRILDFVLFCYDLEREYHRDMYKHLRSLGLKVPISGTNSPYSYYGWKAGVEEGQFTGAHYYWAHPTGAKANEYRNIPMLKGTDPFRKMTLAGHINTAKVRGKPLIVGEWGMPTANDFRNEIVLHMASYACLQDWDALVSFTFLADRDNWDNINDRIITSAFNPAFDVSLVGLYPAAAILFYRQDVKKAEKLIEIEDTPQLYKNTLLNQGGYAYLNKYLATNEKLYFLSYLSRVERNLGKSGSSRADLLIRPEVSQEGILNLLEKKGMYSQELKKKKRFISDTGELTSDFNLGILKINTARSQGAVGYLNRVGRIILRDAIIKADRFSSVILTSLDNKPLSHSNHILLTIVADSSNTDEKLIVSESDFKKLQKDKQFHPSHYTGPRPWGHPTGTGPVMVEPVNGEITLKRNISPSQVTVYALEASGKRKTTLKVERQDEGIGFNPSGKYKTIYYEIVIK